MKNKINLLFLLSISAAGLGFYWKRQQDKNREYHKKCLYLAVLDDAIARLELEGKVNLWKEDTLSFQRGLTVVSLRTVPATYAKEKKITFLM